MGAVERYVLKDRYEIIKDFDLVSNRGQELTTLGVDRQTGIEVLICRLKPLLARDPAVRKDVLFGLQALTTIDHPCVGRILAAEETGEDLYFVRERVSGRSLSRIMREGAVFTEPEVVTTGLRLLEGLMQAHSQGVCFGSVKPSNVIMEVTRERAVLVGLPKPRASFTSFLQVANYIGLTQACAPELLKNGVFDERADIYGVGLVLYQMCIGKLPFPTFPNMADLLGHIIEEGLPRPSSINPGIQPKLDALITRAVSCDPSARFASAAAMYEALRSVEPKQGSLLPRERMMEIVSESFPTPVAELTMRIDTTPNESEQLQHLIDAAQLNIQFTASILIAERLAQGRPPVPAGTTLPDLARPSLGHWCQWLRETSREASNFMPELPRALWDERGRALAPIAEIDRLVSLRNEVRHGVTLPRGDARLRLQEVRPRFERMLREINFLRRYRLFVLDELEFRGHSFLGRMRVLRGVRLMPEYRTEKLQQPIEKNHVCLADAGFTRCLDLYPLILSLACPVCADDELFFYASSGSGKAEYVSFHKGHSLETDATMEDLVRSGLVGRK